MSWESSCSHWLKNHQLRASSVSLVRLLLCVYGCNWFSVAPAHAKNVCESAECPTSTLLKKWKYSLNDEQKLILPLIKAKVYAWALMSKSFLFQKLETWSLTEARMVEWSREPLKEAGEPSPFWRSSLCSAPDNCGKAGMLTYHYHTHCPVSQVNRNCIFSLKSFDLNIAN